MTAQSVVVAVDQGTTSTKALVIDATGTVLGRAGVPVSRRDPRPGYVEQDADELLQSVTTAIAQALDGLDVDVLGLGLSNQRESAIVWDRASGRPVGPVLGWQDRRTTERLRTFSEADGDRIRAITGLPLDPMFSALKLGWLLDEVDPERTAGARGDLCVGTIDSWLVTRLTGEHRIEVGNASRTQLLDIATGTWSAELLERFAVPEACLPRIADSDEPTAPVLPEHGRAAGMRVHGAFGDSHAALFAQGVRGPGAVKATYGTGSSIIGLDGGATTAEAAVAAGLARTIAWGRGEPVRALEGTVLSTGGTVAWVAQLVGREPAELAELAQQVPDAQGVELVPAFAGLGAPWWDESARAVICGFGSGTSSAHLARAAFDSVVQQTEDVLVAIDRCAEQPVMTVLVDGGPAQNDWLMAMQADIGQRTIVRRDIAELSATGAAHLAGLGAGLWSEDEVLALPCETTSFTPQLPVEAAARSRRGWSDALARARLRPEESSISHRRKEESRP